MKHVSVIMVSLVLVASLLLPQIACAQSVIEMLRNSREQAALGNLDEGLRWIDLAVQSDPAYFPLWKQKALIHLYRGEPSLAH